MEKLIGDVIRDQLDRRELPERVKSLRADRPAGEILNWCDELRCYVSDVTGECVWASYVRLAWGLYFYAAGPVARQMELAG